MTVVLPNSVKNARKQIRPLTPVKPARGDALNYFNQLNTLNQDLLNTSDTIQQLIDQGASATEIANTLEEEHRRQVQKYLGLSAVIASAYVASANLNNKNKVEGTVASSFNVPKDTVTVLDDQAIDNVVQASIIENTQLIRSIAPEYFAKVAQAVSNNFKGIPQVDDMTLAERLEDIGGITTRRAQFIARDQTAKVTGSLTRARHQAVGVNSYRWRNSRDRRVVGNPSGLYPKGNAGHGNHWRREGAIFSYRNPPSDGNPGQPYNCRCTAEAVLDINDMDVVYSG